jgi:hypothetical protein
MVSAKGITLVLDRHTDPQVRRPFKFLGVTSETLGALGEYLVGVLRRRRHHVEDPADVVQRHVVMKQVAH